MNRILNKSLFYKLCNFLLCLVVPALTVGSSSAQTAPTYPAWVNGATYQVGAIVSYLGFDYKALVYQTDWVGANWDPADSPTLWSKMGPDGSVPTPQPTSPPAPLPSGCDALWVAGTAYLGGATVSYNGINYQANWWTQGNEPDTSNGVSGSGQPWTIIPGCNGSAPVTVPPVPVTTPPPPVSTPPTPPVPNPSDGSTGTVNFHLLLGVGSAQDSLTLTGGNYTDLIESNIIAGVMMGHLVGEDYPGIQFDKDYLYGSIMGQLLQENIETELYVSTGEQIDPSPDQAAVMGQGQGGPYQINNYAADMVSGTYDPEGHSLINYIALQNNIGYTFATAAQQHLLNTPASFNDKYFGPMLTGYFHYNDFVALNVTGKGPGGWTTPWEPAYDNALANFTNLPNNFLDILLNAAYNQGYYGPLVSYYSVLGSTATASTVASVDDFASVWGNSDSYHQYPYQVRYYLDQLYDSPIPTTGPEALVTPQNEVDFSMASLQTVFTNVFTKLSYAGSNNQLEAISTGQAQTAFNAALSQSGVSPSATLNLSNASDRAQIFTLLEDGISKLEAAIGMQFNATSNGQL